MRVFEVSSGQIDKELMAYANQQLKTGDDTKLAPLAQKMLDMYAKTGVKNAPQVVISNIMNQLGMRGHAEHFEQSVLKDQHYIDNFRELFNKSPDITGRDPLTGEPI